LRKQKAIIVIVLTLAGLAMAMSSVTVVGNSILLGRYKPRFANKKPKREDLERTLYARPATMQRQ
jgi:hypothetical protein